MSGVTWLTAQRNTIRTLRQRPDLSNDDPSTRTPAVTKVDHEQPDHHHSCPASTLVSLPLVLIFGEDDSDDDVASCHSDRADDQDGLAADFVHVCYGWHGCEPHDDADDTTCEERRGVTGKA